MKNQIAKKNKKAVSYLYSTKSFKEVYGYRIRAKSRHIFSPFTVWFVGIQEDLTKIYYLYGHNKDKIKEI